MNFKEWLSINEKSYARLRPELGDIETKKEEISIGDVVELGPETIFKGKPAGKVGKVVEKRFDSVLIQDLTRSSARRYIVPISHLYDKEELRGKLLLPSEEKQLEMLGGKKLWVKLTPRQYNMFKSTYEAEELPEIVPSSHSEEPSDVLKSMFKKTTAPEPEKKLPMFTSVGEVAPLRRFVKKTNLASILRRPE